MARIGVVLSGCGVQDGSEIHEAVLTLLALDRAGAEAVIMAPDKPQADVVNHVTGKPAKEKRNVMVEAARIARGKITDVAKVDAAELDGVILPGGYGAAKNLSTFATEGDACTVDESVQELLRELHAQGKPIAALCIAPTILARIFGEALHPELTIGRDAGTAEALESMGAKHFEASVTEVVVDERNRIVTTPCYMLPARVSEIATGAEKAVRALLSLVKQTAGAAR
ncbi:MAG: isoprenoid biosynthesis glyoxalase ElbB [bacterium]